MIANLTIAPLLAKDENRYGTDRSGSFGTVGPLVWQNGAGSVAMMAPGNSKRARWCSDPKSRLVGIARRRAGGLVVLCLCIAR